MAYIGREPQVGNFQVCDAISVVNGQAAYTMQVNSVNVSPETANHMLVSLNGVLQAPGSSYTVSGSTITFASNLVTGDVINFIHILGSVLDLGVPSDSTVSLAKLTATGTKDATTFLRGDNTFAEAGGGSYELLASTTASNVSSFAINGFFTSDYDVYKFFLYNVYAGSSDQDLKFSVNTTGSYTEQTAGSNYFYAFRRLDGTTSSGTNSEDAGSYQNTALMVGRISDQSAKMSNTEITFYKPTDSSNYKIVTSHFGGWNSSTEICTGTSTGLYLSTTAVTGVTFRSQAGNIWCEKAYLYGLKNS